MISWSLFPKKQLTPHQVDLIVEFAVRFGLTLSAEDHLNFTQHLLPQIRMPLVNTLLQMGDTESMAIFEQICRRIGEGIVMASKNPIRVGPTQSDRAKS
jgi:hypothetical protein